jgi:hypothetical protein
VTSPRSPFYLLLTSSTAQIAFAFEKLLVYQKAMDFLARVCVLTQTFPRGLYFLADDHLNFKSDLEEIAKMLSGLINALDKRSA